MHPTEVPVLDLAAIRAAFNTHAASLSPDDRALAHRTFDRLQPPNWTLEWYLPWWLGHALELPARVAEAIVLSNVLGLVAIRLEDDLLDGEVTDADRASARRISASLLQRAVAIYGPMFDQASPFWSYLDRTMFEWRLAAEQRDPAADGRWWLARRGAPLKVGARAICLLADRDRDWPAVDRCLDHALASLALYDDLCDWDADLEAGRWNAFVASLVSLAQAPETRRRNRSAVLVALMVDDAASRGFGRVQADALKAAVLARAIGSPPLAEHLAESAARAADQGAAVQAHYRAAAHRANELLVGATSRA